MSSCTFITALYNINRETKGDGRKWNDYLDWFKETLQLKAPLVVFVPADLVPFVQEHRHPQFLAHTQIIVQCIEDVPYAHLHDCIQDIICSDQYKQQVMDPSRVECILPFYTIIQYSKFEWLRQIAQSNPFHTEMFFWIDAGASRFIDVNKNATLTSKALPPAKLVIQSSPQLQYYPMDNYLWSNQCLMCGTMFGGDVEACIKKADDIKVFLGEHVHKNKWINNEQIVLAYMARCMCPNEFCTLMNVSNRHLPLFDALFER